jgi:hypothetical protein
MDAGVLRPAVNRHRAGWNCGGRSGCHGAAGWEGGCFRDKQRAAHFSPAVTQKNISKFRKYFAHISTIYH